MIVIGSSPLSWLKESGCNITKYTEHHEAVEMDLLANELQMRSSRFRRIKSAALIRFILIWGHIYKGKRRIDSAIDASLFACKFKYRDVLVTWF